LDVQELGETTAKQNKKTKTKTKQIKNLSYQHAKGQVNFLVLGVPSIVVTTHSYFSK
jgi:hypothetical protein